jgi:5-formyltetrahydrofolate cyclo-ligase
MRDEIDVRPLVGLVSSRSAICALPVMSGKADPLIFRRWRPGDELVDASFGVKEPLASAPPIAPDIVIVPLLGFDAAGNRLGYGGGYYDRTLASLRAAGRALAVGVGYDEQETDRIPVHAGDMPLDMILTDRRTIVPGKTERTD